MKRTVLLTLLGVLLFANAEAQTNDVLVVLPGGDTKQHPPIMTTNVTPFTRGGMALVSTIGQLTKQSDLIFIGTITNVSVAGEHYDWQRVLDVRVQEVLLGLYPSNSIRLPYDMSGDTGYNEDIVSTNVSVIIFASRTEYTPVRAFLWTFDQKDAKRTATGRMTVLIGIKGIIPVSEPTSMISVVRGYIRQLRCASSRDPVEYARFLQSLQSSSNSRIRDDAKDDLLLLLGYGGDTTRQVIIEKAGLSEEMRRCATWFEQKEEARKRTAEMEKGIKAGSQ